MPKIDGDRLWDSLMQMAKIGATPAGGSCRLALSELDKQGRDLFIRWCEDIGCDIAIDQIGNIFATRPGSDPDAKAIATGSHLDTQPTGGKFDGVYGCLSGLEVLRTLHDHNIQTRHPVTAVVWTNEEGTRFPPAMLASGVYCGEFSLEYGLQQTDKQGISVAQALQAIGYDGQEPIGQRRFERFFELHIEQGPVLEDGGERIGVVEGVLGIHWFDITLVGQAAHAGPTPMHLRHDALLAAAECFTALNKMAQSMPGEQARLTVGELDIDKASRNVIPGDLRFSLDIRHPTQEGLNEMEAQLEAIIQQHCAAHGVKAQINCIWRSPPVHFDRDCVGTVQAAVNALGYSHRAMVSGAGHDAVYVSRVAPTSMIFIPSVDGISHNEAEHSTPEQIQDGAQVLFDSILASAQ